MANYKGTTIKTIRKLVKDQGHEREEALRLKLGPEARQAYDQALPTDWLPIEVGAELMQKAAEVLFPGEADGLRRIGLRNARETLTGVYRVFLKIPSIEFVLKRLANIWRTFFDQGQAAVVDYTGKHATLVVTEFPDYPTVLRESICGFIIGLLELTGARNVRVVKRDLDPRAWRWDIDWQ